MTQTEPLLGVYLKAINDTFEALSFSKFKKNKLDVDTFKDIPKPKPRANRKL
jgi:hypothetical protein